MTGNALIFSWTSTLAISAIGVSSSTTTKTVVITSCAFKKEKTPDKSNFSKSISNEPENQKEIEENLSTCTLEELTSTIINQVLDQAVIEPERMSADEKIAIVSQLHEKGVFLLKGSVIEVAERLKTSEATIYRYLKQLSR